MTNNTSIGITPFDEFKEALQTAQPQQHLGPQSRIANAQAFDNIQKHLIDYYQGIDAERSFVDDNGSIFDCIPTEQQPALRGTTTASVTAPDLPTIGERPSGPSEGKKALHVQPLQAGRVDQFGNKMLCPEGTIPVRRLTIENIARFGSLQEFFKKSPFGSGSPAPKSGVQAPPSATAVAATHRWAHAYQGVSNLGGHSFLNVWDPAIGANQVFSLSQHWYTGGGGANLQTAEVGWQVYPQMYGNTKPVFFIYWTADDYNKTGCYNLTCLAFVQTNNSWAIGGTLSPWSTPGGAQYEIEVSFYLYQGRWWLYVGGGASSNAIGYYPASIYGNGALASGASGIDYGGEVVGTTSWPPMGGGAYANAGWQHAAYQKDIRYFPSGGGNVSAQLTGSAASPECFTAQVTQYNAPWNETLWFGGPGGNSC